MIRTFYDIYNKEYVSLKDLCELKKIYKDISIKENLSDSERIFLSNFKNIDFIIEKKNNDYINNFNINSSLLDDVMGYSLDEYQRKVVLSDEEASLVLAGAGTGKSLTIIGKIVYLIKYRRINSEEILVITLTNDFVNSLKNKLLNYYNINIPIFTFHKLSLLLLESNGLEYQIADEEILDDVVNSFINNYVHNNKKIYKAYKYLVKDESDKDKLIKTIKTFIHLFKSSNKDIYDFNNIINNIKFKILKKNDMCMLLLIVNVYLMYQDELRINNLLDFDDMINKAINCIINKGLRKKYKYIIIDEYQDSSIVKVRLIQEIIKYTRAKLLVVGDDYQSIYRFTGSNLDVFLDFKKYFVNSKIFNIVNTYRNPQELIDIAGKFVMKNNRQVKKILISNKHINNPVNIYYINDLRRGFKEILSINKNYNEIMVIGRNNKDINYYLDDEISFMYDNYYSYNEVVFKYMTIHKSKGLEADVVIIINLSNYANSIPSKIKDEKVIKYVKNNKDIYPYEEERRLFYVALTRTRNRVYLLSRNYNESIFVKEIKKYKNVNIIKR